MKRFIVLVLVALGVLAFLVWTGKLPEMSWPNASQDQSLNLAPRALTSAEQTTFLSLTCGGATGAGGGYAHQCTSLTGYPSSDYGGAGLGLGITLQSVIYGHLTSASANEAYVTYAGSFEPHASNYGGGILFTKDASGWRLKKWQPGGQASSCVLLTPTGRARFVCLNSWEGQGEADSHLTLTTLPPPSGNAPTLLSARDLRDTMTPNANCQTWQPDKNILLSINTLMPTPKGAEAEISYVSAKMAQTACRAGQFANAPVTTAAITLKWQDDQLKIAPALNFVDAP